MKKSKHLCKIILMACIPLICAASPYRDKHGGTNQSVPTYQAGKYSGIGQHGISHRVPKYEGGKYSGLGQPHHRKDRDRGYKSYHYQQSYYYPVIVPGVIVISPSSNNNYNNDEDITTDTTDTDDWKINRDVSR